MRKGLRVKIITVKEFYIRTLPNSPFHVRFSYVALNEFGIDFNRFKSSKNPLRWCLIDVIKWLYFPVLCCLWLALLPTAMLYSANKIKTRYESRDYIGTYVENAKILVFDDEVERYGQM